MVIDARQDRSGTNADFKARAQSAADRREYTQSSGGGGAPKSNDKK